MYKKIHHQSIRNQRKSAQQKHHSVPIVLAATKQLQQRLQATGFVQHRINLPSSERLTCRKPIRSVNTNNNN